MELYSYSLGIVIELSLYFYSYIDNRMYFKNLILPFFIVLVIGQGCSSPGFGVDEEYNQSDSLFLGMYLGMGQQDFFNLCTELNQKELITQGPGGNTNVEHRMTDEFDSEVSMRFFPTFIENKVFEMPVTYSYIAWAPWNKQYWADSLLEKVLDKYKIWYGDDFKLINHPDQGKVYYKIDGKRRINLFIRDEQFVQAVFTDLKVEKRLREEFEKTKPSNYEPSN
ncbi:hypothetical protein U3A58_14005 [Algoriphagus sp. C2-6-M1]|uniref:hypothetical protein n=1 Tax=Algoriphagus persicinus TaxID=3108754 RepID=UPI002B3D5AB2|nr:hypothetical protein [Algoriphagus sp. C2-6-M1]MEB2781510.1 hypothetical protein [Algoriphagus sp. C2-6-M1]